MIEFGFCSPPNENDKLELLTTFNACRESATGNIWAFFNQRYFAGTRNISLIKELKFDKTHVLIRQVATIGSQAEAAFENTIKCGLRIINILEDTYGWKRSKIHDVVLENAEKYMKNWGGIPAKVNYRMFLLEGDARWIQSPQMLTLYMLLIRSGKIPEMQDVVDIESLMKVMKLFSRLRSGDKYFIRTALKFVAVLMKRYTELFGMMKENYGSKAYRDHISVVEGISFLCNGHTRNDELFSRFVKLSKAEKIKGAEQLHTRC
jgi:hypothetical protein